jgi:hypothetical protein
MFMESNFIELQLDPVTLRKNPTGMKRCTTVEAYILSKYILCDFAYITVLIFHLRFLLNGA